MSIDLVFNELSLVPLAQDKYALRQRMSAFVIMLGVAKMQDIAGPLRVPETFHIAELAPGYSINDWANDPDNDQDERVFLKRLTTQAPFLADLANVHDTALEYQFKIGSETANGCGIAYLLKGLSVSLQSEPRWEMPFLCLTVDRLLDDDILTETVEIVHASCEDHVIGHRGWIKKRLTNSISTGNEMWERRNELYPSLIFCDRVEKQMRELEEGSIMLQPVATHLLGLEEFCKSWTQGSFDATRIQLPVSRESSVTLAQFAERRSFLCPDGIKRVFNWHTKIPLNAWRIHFSFDESRASTLIIGHIGKHLPTVSDRT